MTPPIVNAPNTALVFEGGGMRAAYTSAVVATLVNEGVVFPHVSGISAGSSNTANYVSRDPDRARASFVDFAANPDFGSVWTWIQGKGYFNSQYIYEEAYKHSLPFNWDEFISNPAAVRMGAFDCEAGVTRYFGKEDIPDIARLMKVVRASSSLPLLMPQVEIDGTKYCDGALGSAGGIPLDAAQADGYERFFVVLSQPRSFVKPPYKPEAPYRWFYRKQPAVAEGIMSRPKNYNRVREELFDLEAQGKAYLFFPDQMSVNSRTRDLTKLRQSYAAGYAQSHKELPRWREFLGL
ncbi:MAG: patatin family protein [Propionibacteriaceae bacterium]|jgi:predicted patatin/cPLA2 family phospholipase|nr:patatin family protein [Propionibacteriaceae bacterium]